MPKTVYDPKTGSTRSSESREPSSVPTIEVASKADAEARTEKAKATKAADEKVAGAFPKRADFSDDASYYAAIKAYRKKVDESKAGTIARALEKMK